MDISRYRHNNKGFCENLIFPQPINKEIMIKIEVHMQA